MGLRYRQDLGGWKYYTPLFPLSYFLLELMKGTVKRRTRRMEEVRNSRCRRIVIVMRRRE
jgi:hypothetical protein